MHLSVCFKRNYTKALRADMQNIEEISAAIRVTWKNKHNADQNRISIESL